MARVDADAVLTDLSAWIAETKTGYGREELLRQIATLRRRHAVGEDLLDRVIRLYGGPVELLRHLARMAEQTPEAVPSVVDADERGGSKADDLGHTTTRGGHDGRAERIPAHAG